MIDVTCAEQEKIVDGVVFHSMRPYKRKEPAPLKYGTVIYVT